ncbi:MAG: nitroreductase family protein [Steroidobacteraceae bacterium]|jgi:nitroreductase
MIQGSTVRRADHTIDRIFLDRWSPRAMSGEPLSHEELLSLFEAARWAPSSGNGQPWRILFARRDTPEWPVFFGLLASGNQIWCVRAAALVVFVSRTPHERTGRPSVTHSYDTGAAWGYFALQGYLKGYVVHGMEGFDYERARRELGIPEEYRVEAMAAVGRPAPTQVLTSALQARETPSDRRPLSATVCEGAWRFG